MTETWRPKVGAILTVLGWNLLPLIGLAAWIWAVLAAPKTGEDWSGVVAVILMIFGGGATCTRRGGRRRDRGDCHRAQATLRRGPEHRG
jgi:hypothetical protein